MTTPTDPTPRKRVSAATKLLALALPLATLVTFVILLAAAGTPQVGAMPDVLAYALELAPRTMYAIAIGGTAAVSMQVTGMNIPNAERARLMQASWGGDIHARAELDRESVYWLAWTLLWLVVYLH